jgi:CBS-domain-containing membrane protein
VSLTEIKIPFQRQLLGTLGVVAFLLVLSLLDVATRGAVSLPALVPPFGASVVIVFFTPESPMGRPRNVVLGHLSCAFAAATVLHFWPTAHQGVQAAMAVAAGGLLMLATRSFHAPGGATALLAVVTQPHLGFGMLLCPILLGALTLVGTRALLDLAIARVHALFAALKPSGAPKSNTEDLETCA